jgi:hypothetical protein
LTTILAQSSPALAADVLKAVIMAVHIHVNSACLLVAFPWRNKSVSEFILLDQQLINCPDRSRRKIKIDIIIKSHAKNLCLEDGSEQLLELGGVPMLAAAADGVVADDDLPWRLRQCQRIVQILMSITEVLFTHNDIKRFRKRISSYNRN